MGTFSVTSLFEIISKRPEHTLRIGRMIGERCRRGDLLALCGLLGAGKTQFVKGLALGLGVPGDEPVTSPTFVLLREYAGRITLFHGDLYRIASKHEADALGLDELRADGAVALEWADRFPALIPRDAIRIDFEHRGTSERLIRIACGPIQAAALELERLLDKAAGDRETLEGDTGADS